MGKLAPAHHVVITTPATAIHLARKPSAITQAAITAILAVTLAITADTNRHTLTLEEILDLRPVHRAEIPDLSLAHHVAILVLNLAHHVAILVRKPARRVAIHW